jgi:hypothetical protein
MRGSTMHAWLLALLAFCATAVLGVLVLLLAVAKPAAPTAPDYRVVALGRLQYQAMLGRPIKPRNTIDASMVAGLSAGDRRLRSGHMLFGAFIAVANDSLRPVPAAEHIDLRDDAGHVYQPLHLPATNPYAYVPRAILPKTRLPRVGTPADDNLAATGQLLLYRIPADRYESGILELVIHDARHPRHVAYLDV